MQIFAKIQNAMKVRKALFVMFPQKCQPIAVKSKSYFVLLGKP
jgi:hypothetical protein